MKYLHEELEELESKQHTRMRKELGRLDDLIGKEDKSRTLTDEQMTRLIIDRCNLHRRVRKLDNGLLIEHQELIDKQPKDIRSHYYAMLNQAYEDYYTGTFVEKYIEAKKSLAPDEKKLYHLCELMNMEIIEDLGNWEVGNYGVKAVRDILINPHYKDGRDPLK